MLCEADLMALDEDLQEVPWGEHGDDQMTGPLAALGAHHAGAGTAREPHRPPTPCPARALAARGALRNFSRRARPPVLPHLKRHIHQ